MSRNMTHRRAAAYASGCRVAAIQMSSGDDVRENLRMADTAGRLSMWIVGGNGTTATALSLLNSTRRCRRG